MEALVGVPCAMRLMELRITIGMIDEGEKWMSVIVRTDWFGVVFVENCSKDFLRLWL